MTYRLEDFLNKIKPVGIKCGVSVKEMEALGRLLMREAAWKEPVVELKEDLIGRLNNLLTEYDKTLIVRSDGLFEINDNRTKPIIKKSGETWVARYDGVDYLCLTPLFYKNVKPSKEQFKACIAVLSISTIKWKQISEIEITDELAKIRPMVVINSGTENKRVLPFYGVTEKEQVLCEVGWSAHTSNFRLANVDDLKSFGNSCLNCIYMQDPLLTNDVIECWLNEPIEVKPEQAETCDDFDAE